MICVVKIIVLYKYQLEYMNHVKLKNDGLDRYVYRVCSFIEWKIGIRKIMSVTEPVAKQYTIIFIKAHKFITNIFHKEWPTRYTDANPFKLIYLSPTDITHHLEFIPRRGWVVSENMDENSIPFFELPIPQCLKLRYDNGYDWHDPELKPMFINALKNHRDGWEYSGIEYKNRCDELDEIYNSMENEGYKSQKQLIAEDRAATHINTNDTVHPFLNEVGVSINEDGEFLWSRCGMNRLALAKILDIESIPVMVYLRHQKWQSVRNKIQDISNKEELPDQILAVRNHPDLSDIWST